MKKRYLRLISLFVIMTMLFCACGKKTDDKDTSGTKTDNTETEDTQKDDATVDGTDENKQDDAGTDEGKQDTSTDDTSDDTNTGDSGQEPADELTPKEIFSTVRRSTPYKYMNDHNPLITQSYGADPYAIVYNDTVYVYMTGDTYEYDKEGNLVSNSYGKVNTIKVVSSKDLVNWTDCGSIRVAGRGNAATWASQSWAPSVAYKNIDGKDKFFLYFANNASNIGVLVSDSPTGPFTDPIGKPLITREMQNCGDVTWLFDPGVFVDDDGSAYIYFGGGVPEGKDADPGTIRCAKLGADMTSIEGDIIKLDVPYVFEASCMNKIGDTYYYTYCSNWNVPQSVYGELGIKSAQICYMTSDNPMGPFTLQGAILKNPYDYFKVGGNNHQSLFEFHGEWYIAYHSQILDIAAGNGGMGYRSTNIDKLTVREDGKIELIEVATKLGVKQVGTLDVLNRVEAETMSTMAGINTRTYIGASNNVAVNEFNTGDWIYLEGCDFGSGANTFTASVYAVEGQSGLMEIKVGGLGGEVVGYFEITPGDEGFREISVKLDKEVSGVHNMLLTFYGEGFMMDYWNFSQE